MELIQRATLAWTLVVSVAIVSSNGDILINSDEARPSSRLENDPTPSHENVKIEDRNIPQYKRPNGIIVQPGYEANSKSMNSQSNKPNSMNHRSGYGGNSKIKNRQVSFPVRPSAAGVDVPKSEIPNSPNSIIPSNQSAKSGSPPYFTPNITVGHLKNQSFRNPQSNPLHNFPAQPATAQNPQNPAPQPSPSNPIILRPGYDRPEARIGMPRPQSPGNIVIQPGYHLPVQPGYQQIYGTENPQAVSTRRILVQPGYGSYVGRAQSVPPRPAGVEPSSAQSVEIQSEQPRPASNVRFQVGQDGNPKIQNPQAAPPKNIVLQATYGRPVWVGIPQQTIIPAAQTVYVESFNHGKPESELPQSAVVRPKYGPSYWVGIPQYNPVYKESSRHGVPEYDPTKVIAILPGYGQNAGAQTPQSNSSISRVEPPQNIIVQPRKGQNYWLGIPQLNSPNNLAVQPGNEQNVEVVDPQPSPPASTPVQPGNQQNARGRPSPSIINISFLRGYDQGNLRAENPQEILPGSVLQSDPNIPAQSGTNFVVQPSDVQPNSRYEVPQMIAPDEFPTLPGPVQPTPGAQNAQSNPPGSVIAEPANGESAPLVGHAHSYVPINLRPPIGFDRIPLSSNPAIQSARNINFLPAHGKPILKVIATKSTPPREVLVQPGYGQLQCHLKFIPQGNFVPSPPRDPTLEAELQRNRDLQELVLNQLYVLENQTRPDEEAARRGPPPFISDTSSHTFTRHGAKGLKKKKFGWRTAPTFLRATPAAPCTERSQYARSIGPDSGCSGPELPQMRITSEAASISQKNVSEVVDSLKPEVNPVINSYVGPALDAIRSRHQQRNNSNATTVITTRIVDAAKGFEKKISDAVTPLLGNQGNQAPPKNPNDSQNPQTNPPNVPGTDYRGAFDLQRPENKEKFGGLPMTSNPGAVVNFVDEYGRKIVGTVPTAFNAAIGNSNAYLKAFYDNLKGMVH